MVFGRRIPRRASGHHISREIREEANATSSTFPFGSVAASFQHDLRGACGRSCAHRHSAGFELTRTFTPWCGPTIPLLTGLSTFRSKGL
jgi:hypothetical protein